IEQDDVSIIPGGFFYKSFVKQYSRALGLDFGLVEPDVEKVMPAEVQDPLPALSVSYQVAKTEGRISRFPNRAIWAAALLLSTLAGGGGFYRWWQKNQQGPGDRLPDPVPVVQAAPPHAPQAIATVPPKSDIPPAAAEVAAPVTVAEVPAVADQTKAETAKLSVGLSAKERTWVKVSSDGKTVFSGVLDASQTKNIEGLENAKLVTGNAAGLDVRWNGRSIGPLGTHGQVMMVVFTRENFQIISRRKM
ncbi:MAG: RodZ domain-containing protein, partial [Bryobacteraceae bacterium]